MTDARRRFLVTSALPYANNRPHLGHVAGAYLPADIYVRYLRMLGDDVVFICGSDDHGVAAVITAQKEGATPEAIVAKNRALQDEAFKALDIIFDIYSGTSTCPHHVELSQEFFQRVHDMGRIVPKETDQFFCLQCDRFLPDRYVEGTCPKCGAEAARGDQCDTCTESFEQTALIEPYCAICRSTPEIRRTRHWFMTLDDFRAPLLEYLEGREDWRESVRNYAMGIVRQGLPERSMTRDLSWGVPVPLEGGEGKVLYVWFDAPIGYISFTRELFEQRGDPDGWKPYWQDPETRLVHFIGKDNTIFHAVIWPAILMAQESYILPHNIPANEYLLFKGEKLSKSRGTVVWADEFLKEYPTDRVRYYLSANSPEGRDTSFTYEDFIKRNNDELSDVLGNLCHRVFTFATKRLGGEVPAGIGDHAPAAELFAEMAAARDRWQQCLEGVRIRDGLAVLIDLARAGNRAFDAAEPWKTRKEDPERCALDIGSFLELVHAVSVMLLPYLPGSAEKLLAAFGRSEVPGAGDIAAIGGPVLTAGSTITAPGILFPRLEDVEPT